MTAKLRNKEEKALSRGKRKERGIQSQGNNRSHEFVMRPGMLEEWRKASLNGWQEMVQNKAKLGPDCEALVMILEISFKNFCGSMNPSIKVLR